ncbi:adiponectin receptor protein [Thraustotheca clavata]|uniref:Adiponectin receptor protein n=1 Tax=Thraustotheca clavata TaxID=74557 RepID=A0A1V9ZZ59_9STRA|nr:adiponectin receptor protein [Thraustotheca clavata]
MSGAAFVQKALAENGVTVFSKTYCPYCTKAKNVLSSVGVPYVVYDLDTLPNGDDIMDALYELTGRDTVPNVFVKSTTIGGGDDVTQLHREVTYCDIFDLIMTAPRIQRLGQLDELELHEHSFLAHNPFIRSGYRLHYHSPLHCLKSLFQLHNETWNVWSHLVGAMLFGAFFISVVWIDAPSTLYHPKVLAPPPLALCHGRHTREYFLEYIAPPVIPMYYTLRLNNHAQIVQNVHVAAVLLQQSLARVPTLEGLHPVIAPQVSLDVQSTLADYFGSMASTLRDFEAKMPSKMAISNYTKESFNWVVKYNQLHPLHDQLFERTHQLTSYVKTLRSSGRYRSIQHILHEFHTWSESIANGLQAIEAIHPVELLTPELATWPILVYVATAFICMTCSTIYHLFFVQSAQASVALIQLDYAGIILLIGGAFFPVIYYGFYCNTTTMVWYLGIVSALSLISFVASLHPAFDAYPSVRSFVFLTLGFFGFVPLMHLVYTYGFWDMNVQVIFYRLMGTAAFDVLGAIIWGLRVPERFAPGRFDVWFSSHQWWHLCVIGATTVHYINAMQHYEWRASHGCPILL